MSETITLTMTREEIIEHMKVMGQNAARMDDVMMYVMTRKDCEVVMAAAEFLEVQEPRIVTEADFENADETGFIPAWCEEKDAGEVYCECISIGALEDAKFGRVRWWTSRPTDEQMEAVPWLST